MASFASTLSTPRWWRRLGREQHLDSEGVLALLKRDSHGIRFVLIVPDWFVYHCRPPSFINLYHQPLPPSLTRQMFASSFSQASSLELSTTPPGTSSVSWERSCIEPHHDPSSAPHHRVPKRPHHCPGKSCSCRKVVTRVTIQHHLMADVMGCVY